MPNIRADSKLAIIIWDKFLEEYKAYGNGLNNVLKIN